MLDEASDLEDVCREEKLEKDLAAVQLLTYRIRSEAKIFTCEENVEGRPQVEMFKHDEVLASFIRRCTS